MRIGLFGAQGFEISQHQFGFDRVGVGDRIDLAFDMGNVLILETAQHMNDRVDFTDIGKKLIAKPLASRRTTHKTGNVDK